MSSIVICVCLRSTISAPSSRILPRVSPAYISKHGDDMRFFEQNHPESSTSRAGLNAANFFQAEAVGVVLPVLNGY